MILCLMRQLQRRLPSAMAFVVAILAVQTGFAFDWLAQLETLLPQAGEQFTENRSRAIETASASIEKWCAERTWTERTRVPAEVVGEVRQLMLAKKRVDHCLDRVLALRSSFVELPEGESQRESARHFLQITTHLIDLSGRMRYLLRDAIDNASYELTPHPDQLVAMFDLMVEQRVPIAAAVMSFVLFDPEPDSGLRPFPDAVKLKELELIAATKQSEMLPQLVRFIRQKNVSPTFKLRAAEAIKSVGLPQDPLPAQDAPDPEITAKQLREIVAAINESLLDDQQKRRRSSLLTWLNERIAFGVTGDTFHFGNLRLRSGDWLLMRSPSPYNMFTDLAPGLFTHVGVVSVHADDEGIRRFVIVDLPERGDRIPAITVDAYLKRTLHYFFLRHKDPIVREKMGEAASLMVGNETQFDLTFKTERVLALRGKPLKDQRINTYCAGFLLLCAQHSGEPREQFFPFRELPAGGHCPANLAKLGLSIGDDFVTPTGAIFSPHLEIVARRQPMYSPAREVKEGIYDHFATVMVEKKLTPSPTTYQALREKLAGLSKFNPWLAKTLAKTNNVSEHMDLQAAARASAVIETLDEIANASADQFFDARYAMNAHSTNELVKYGYEPEDIEKIKHNREKHRHLYSRWTSRQLSPRELRIELVDYYKKQGRRSLDERFFSTQP